MSTWWPCDADQPSPDLRLHLVVAWGSIDGIAVSSKLLSFFLCDPLERADHAGNVLEDKLRSFVEKNTEINGTRVVRQFQVVVSLPSHFHNL